MERYWEPVSARWFRLAILSLSVHASLAAGQGPENLEVASLEVAARNLQEELEAVARIRRVGGAWLLWCSDASAQPFRRLEAVEVGQSPFVVHLTYDQLVVRLVRTGRTCRRALEELDALDSWGNVLEFWVDRSPGRIRHLLVRSPGADGRFSGSSYRKTTFPDLVGGQDLVWADGHLISVPDGK